MKKSRKFLSLLCALCMTMALAAPAFAAEEASAPEPPAVQEITPRAPTIPTSSTSLPYNATTEGLCEGCGTYTSFYFAPSGTDIKVSGTFSSSGDQNDKSRNAKIYLYEVGNSTAIDSYTVAQFTGSTTVNKTFSNLSTNKNYYFDFRNTTPHNFWVDRWLDFDLTLS